jgi:HAD superfamily hydrolase (TIGR01450 family)
VRSDTAGVLILDLDGVVYLDSQGVPGAGEALERIREAGWRMLFATNNSTKTADIVADHIRARTGFPARPEDAVTSAMAAAALAATMARSALVVGSDALRTEIASAGVRIVDGATSRPDAVIVGLDRHLTYRDIDRAARAIRAGSAFIATNVDPTYPTPDGLAPGAGSIVAAVATASGEEPISCGKPSEFFSALITERLPADPDVPVWVVGDRPDTDIALAKANGWSSILVLTGVTSDADEVPPQYAPDAIASTIADVPAIIGASHAPHAPGG